MTNDKTVTMSRELAELRKLAEQACGTSNDSPEYKRFLAAMNPTLLLDLTAPVVERQEPVLDLESAAKVLANCMDYPWEHMPENGRVLMRKHARDVISAALTRPNDSGERR